MQTWARHAAFQLTPEFVRGQTIDVREFEDLHTFEQRVAISFALRRRHDMTGGSRGNLSIHPGRPL